MLSTKLNNTVLDTLNYIKFTSTIYYLALFFVNKQVIFNGKMNNIQDTTKKFHFNDELIDRLNTKV